MADTNLSVVLCGKGDLQLLEKPVPEPGPGDVQFAVHSVGICGSDIGLWNKGSSGNVPLQFPLVLGHEASGTITKLGEGVTNLKVGDRVAVEPSRPCRKCPQCKTGNYLLCEHGGILGVDPAYGGSMCRYNVHFADFCYRLPDNVSLEEGALLEPLSVGTYACKRAGVFPGQKVLICGSGTIGLACAMVAKAMGVTEVCVIDTLEDRLNVAKKLGATYTHLVDTEDGKVVAAKVKQILGGMPDCTLVCRGTEAAVETAVYATRSGGVVVLCGIQAQTKTPVPLSEATLRQVDLLGILGYPNCYPTALNLVASGLVNIKALVTHRFPLTEALEAFEVSKSRRDNAIKVIVCCEKTSS